MRRHGGKSLESGSQIPLDKFMTGNGGQVLEKTRIAAEVTANEARVQQEVEIVEIIE